VKKEERNYIYYLEDILLSMQRVQEYVKELEFINFKRDYKTVDAVIRNFEIIGEAAKNLPQKIKEKHPDLPWEEMYRLRNKVTHEYFGIDYEIIWDIASNQLPTNQLEIEKIIEKEKNTGASRVDGHEP